MVTIAHAEDMLHASAPEGDDSDAAVVERFYVEYDQSVQLGDAIALLRSARYVYDLPADAVGTVADFLVTVGGTVEIGAPLIQLRPLPHSQVAGAGASSRADRALQATPLARKIADARALNLGSVVGSGPGGRLRAADVWAALGEQPVRSAPPRALLPASSDENPHRPAEPERPSAEARQGTAPRASTTFAVYIDGIRARQARDRTRHARLRVAPSVADYVAHAALAELVHARLINSQWTEHGILIYGAINLGIMTGGACPCSTVIAKAADLSPEGLARARQGAASDKQGDRNRQPPHDQPTFVIRDDAAGGVWWTQTACSATCGMILGVSQPRRIPAVADELLGAKIAVREQVTVTAEYDTRYLPQPEVDAFLRNVKNRVERWREV